MTGRRTGIHCPVGLFGRQEEQIARLTREINQTTSAAEKATPALSSRARQLEDENRLLRERLDRIETRAGYRRRGDYMNPVADARSEAGAEAKMVNVTCAFCAARGRDPFGIMSQLATCQVCGGTGRRVLHQPTAPCAFCRGTGVHPGSRMTCTTCRGVGVVEITGKGRALARAMPAYAAQRGQGLIQMDGILRANAGAGLDERVAVRRVEAQPARLVVLTPVDAPRFAVGACRRATSPAYSTGFPSPRATA